MRRNPLLAAILVGLSALLMGQAVPAPVPTAPATSPGASVILSQVVHDVDYRRAEPERLILTLRVTPDPAQRLIYLQRVVGAEKALDDRGHSLVRAEIPADLRPESVSPSFSASDLVQVVLQPPGLEGERPKKIQMIQGVIEASRIVKTETVELAAPGTVTKTYGSGVKATFTLTMKAASSCTVECAFDLPAGITAEDRKNFSSQNVILKAQVTDASGTAWQSGGGSSGGNAQRVFNSTNYTAPAGSTAVPKVSFEVITETQPANIPFKVENIPLP